MEAVQASETSVNSYQSTRRYNPEGGHLQLHTVGGNNITDAINCDARAINMGPGIFWGDNVR
jgi:hypothetical protein